MYSLSSYCDVICNSFTLCSIDTVTQAKSCIDVGNLMTVSLNKYHSINLESFSIYSFFGTLTTLNGLECVSNLGVIGLQFWPSDNLNTMNLVRIATNIVKANSSFSVNIDQNELTSLVLNYDDYCTNGFDFVYKNGSIQSMGLKLETRNKLQDEIFYSIRLCSYNSNSTNMFDTVCVDNEKLDDGHICLRNLGINFLFENRFRIPGENETIVMYSFYLIYELNYFYSAGTQFIN